MFSSGALSLRTEAAPNASYLHQQLLWSLSLLSTVMTHNMSLSMLVTLLYILIQAHRAFVVMEEIHCHETLVLCVI